MTAKISRPRRAALGLCAGLGFSVVLLLPLCAAAGQAPSTAATAATPDLSGVWRTINPPAAPRVNTSLRWVPAPGELPSFTPVYEAKYKKVVASRESGSEETEPEALCLPPGMPYHMHAEYGLEVIQGRDKIAFFSEWMDAYRRVFMDGRKTPKDPEPLYFGYSTGHWEGDTLVVETTNLREDTVLDRYGSPHSDAMRITERIRLESKDVLEDRFVVQDPKAFTKPWEDTLRYRRAVAGNDELRENTCTEGLQYKK